MRDRVVSVLNSFEDLAMSPAGWNELLARGPSNCVFLTYQWQRAWWESLGRGELLLITVHDRGKVIALAPLFSEAGMIYFVGSGGSDYLGFVGDVRDTGVLTLLLDTARRSVRDFIGFVFYLVPDRWPLAGQLAQVADQLGLQLFDQGHMVAPAMECVSEQAPRGAAKTSLVRHERYFRRTGVLQVQHLVDGDEIAPHLDAFFEQHVRRWRATPYPSLFQDPRQREFYQRLTRQAGPEGWLRFTRVDWNGSPIAFHFGFCYAGTFLWYKPSFEVELARRSPGEVLLRQLLLAADAERASVFDFGIGDEPFKRRFATRFHQVRTWGLYTPEKLPSGSPEKYA